MAELNGVKTRCLTDNSELVRKLDELQNEVNQANRIKSTLSEQVDDARTSADTESKARTKLISENKTLQVWHK